MIIYLAGGFYSNWRERIISRFPNHVFIDPSKHGLIDEKEYTKQDVFDIYRSALIIAYLEANNPAGHNMAFECGLGMGIGVPFIFINENKSFDKYIGMLRVSCSQYYDSFETAINTIVL